MRPWMDIDEVGAATGASKRSIYRGMNAGTFPKNFPVDGVRKHQWETAKVLAWIQGQTDSAKRFGERS